MNDHDWLEAFINFIEGIYWDGYYKQMKKVNPQQVEYEYLDFTSVYCQ